MVHKRYIIDLTHEERERLLAFISKGKASARALLKARILLRPMRARRAKAGRTAALPRRSKPTSP